MARRDDRSEATRLQDRIIDGCNASLDAGRHVFISAPTGSGKTRKFSRIAAHQADKGLKVLVLCNRRKLAKQGAERMRQWVERPVETSMGMDGHIDQQGQVVYSTVQTAHERRGDLATYDRVIYDEAHHATTDNVEFVETMETLRAKNPKLLLIGASATPPEGYEGLDPALRAADKHVMTFEEAVRVKLVRLPETKCPAMLYEDNQRIEHVVAKHRKSRTSAALESGISKELGRMRGDDWAEQSVSKYEQYMEGRRTLAFFDSIKEADAFVEEARLRNIEVGAIHSRQSDRDNEALREAFESRKIPVLVSVDMISEGYDIDCDAILLDKKTTSATEYKQIIGRASRGHGEDGDERPLLVDLGAPTLIHGDIVTQAQMQTVRGELERSSLKGSDLLPDKVKGRLNPWVEMKIPGTDRSVYGTSVDGAIVYAAPTPTGYAAFQSRAEPSGPRKGTRNGARIDLMKLEGERPGLLREDALGDWVANALLRNEKSISRLMARTGKDAGTELERMVTADWQKNSNSIERSISMLAQYPVAARAMAQRATQNHR